jgi:hypothetical protein
MLARNSINLEEDIPDGNPLTGPDQLNLCSPAGGSMVVKMEFNSFGATFWKDLLALCCTRALRSNLLLTIVYFPIHIYEREGCGQKLYRPYMPTRDNT